MPATETLALTRFERRVKYCQDIAEEACSLLFLLGCCAGLVALIVLTGVETVVQYYPELCFDVASDCEVLSITHEYNVSDLTCADSFVYVWKFFTSPVLFEQVERRRSVEDECVLDLDISEQNSTLRNGTNECFRLQPMYAAYAEFFNCAPVLESNNVTVGKCQTLLTPVSTYDATLLYGLMSIVVFVCLCQILICCCEDDEFNDMQFWVEIAQAEAQQQENVGNEYEGPGRVGEQEQHNR